MSSESEDEFQSADEGSDIENLECIPQVLAKSSLCMNSDPCVRVDKIREDQTYNEAGMEKFNRDASSLTEMHFVKNTKDKNGKAETCLADMLCKSHKESVSVVMSELSVIASESVREKASHQLEVHSKDSVSGVNEITDLCAAKLEGGNMTEEYMQGGVSEYHLDRQKKSENDEAQPNEMVRNKDEMAEESEEEPKSSLCKSEVTSSAFTECTKPERDHDSGIHGGRRSKAMRQSKIGMKKPREKLGERLGARRINVNTVSISTDSTSCLNATRPMEEESEKMLSSNQRNINAKVVSKFTDSASCMVTVTGVGEIEDEKSKKRQQWEEQQERWHQALNLDMDGKKALSKDGDGSAVQWGGWGSTLLSAATTFTREVGRGMGTVMETVEVSIGAPNPEVMAQEVVKEEQEKRNLKEKSVISTTEDNEEADKENQAGSKESSLDSWQSGQQMETSYGLGSFSLGSIVSGVSGALETASSKVLMGGLDTLEIIGRKAMDVIQEGDPGLKRKRAFLSNKKPNLSQTLQEARQRAAKEEKEWITEGRSAKHSQKPSFEQAWEDSEGPVHLEAISLVAKQCQSKKTSIVTTFPHHLQDKLHSENTIIKTTCELDEEVQLDRDLVEVVPIILAQTGLPLHPQKLIEAWSSVQEKAVIIQKAELEKREHAENELYGTLAKLVTQLCGLAHKGGELALITPEINPLDVAQRFKELAQVVSGSLENMTDQVCGSITSGADIADTQVKDTITNIYVQAATCNNYIQQSLVSLASVLQYSNTKLAAAQL